MSEDKKTKPIILIAEHSEMNSSITQAMLGSQFETIVVDNGVQAIEVLEQRHGELAMVLLDATMPQMTGIEVLEVMNERGWIEEIPVMMMPGDDSSDVMDRAYELGALDYLSHTMTRKHLRNRVANVLTLFGRQKNALYSVMEQNAKLSEERFRLLNMDELTGCLNFEGFKEKARWLMMRNPNLHYEFWYCDIKQFKLINDAFGYDNGDRLLKQWFHLVSDCLDEFEAVGRVNADKQVVLAYTKEGEQVGTRYDKVNAKLRDFLNEPGISYEVEVAAGVYLTKPEQRTNPNINQMVDMAIVAQKSIKEQKGSNFAIYSEELWKKKQRAAKISRELESAIEKGEISIWLQPQYNYATGEMVGAEALCRWFHSELGFISPGEFIPILEKSGQIPVLDRFVWEEACRCVKRWQIENPDLNIALSVNVSRMDIREAGFFSYMKNLVEKYDLPPEMLRLEITESAYMDEPEQLIDAVKSLQNMGFMVEMDDFGSGYSSLNMLKEVPVDVVKLDMKFLSQSENNSRSGNILSSVVRLSHSLELPVIAEGVETAEQANFLKNLGCNLMQGYWFAKPLPVSEFEQLIKVQKIGEMPHGFKGSGVKELDEVMDSRSNSSFIFDSCIGGAMLLEYDGEHVEAVMVNDAFYETTGVKRETFERYRRDLLARMGTYAGNRFKQTLNTAVANGISSDTGHQLKNGRVLAVKYRRVSSGEHSHVLFALVEDITTTYEMQQKLDKVTEEYYSHMELMPGGFFRYDADGDQRFTFVSSSMLDMLGYNLDDFMMKFNGCFPNMVYEEDRARVMRELDAEIAEGVDTYCEYRIEKADGTLKWVYDAGRLITDEDGHRWYYVVITDMDERKEMLQEQLWQKTMYQTLAELSDTITFDYNPLKDELTVYISTRTGVMRTREFKNFSTGVEAMDWLTKESYEDMKEGIGRAVESASNGFVEFKGQFTGRDKPRWYRAYYTSVVDDNGKVYRVTGRVDDIERDRKRLQNWKKQGERDVITGILNHDSSLIHIDTSIKRDKGGILFMVDVDNFTMINERFGRACGDDVLLTVAKTLRELLGKEAIIGRLGDDEFVAFIPGACSERVAEIKAKEILYKVNEMRVAQNTHVQCNVGVAFAADDAISASELFRQADSALYESKRTGKGVYTFFEPNMTK